MEKIFYTDGACSKNGTKDSKGGWAFVEITIYEDNSCKIETKEGGKQNTTNNEMELSAVYYALVKALKEKAKRVTIYSDCAYVVNAIEKRWIERWNFNGWKTAEGNSVKNKEIWEKIYNIIYKYQLYVKMEKVKGHNNDPLNELADRLAVNARIEVEQNEKDKK